MMDTEEQCRDLIKAGKKSRDSTKAFQSFEIIARNKGWAIAQAHLDGIARIEAAIEHEEALGNFDEGKLIGLSEALRLLKGEGV